MEYFLILFSLLFITAGQWLQKIAANKAFELGNDVPFLFRIFALRETWWAILSLATGMVLWLCVLYFMEVSRAFPFLSLGFVLVMLVSHFHFNEIISPTRWLGVGCIVAGIVMVSVA